MTSPTRRWWKTRSTTLSVIVLEVKETKILFIYMQAAVPDPNGSALKLVEGPGSSTVKVKVLLLN